MSVIGILEKLELRGLRPKEWLTVGPGYAREEIKGRLLGRGLSFVGEAVLRLEEICLRVLSAESGHPLDPARVLGGMARQEGLRQLLADSRISSRMPELKRLRRQSGFFRKLDRAIQGGRLAFANGTEREICAEKLSAKLGANPLRQELEALGAAFDAWLGAMELWDTPRLLREATRILEDGKPPSLRLPERIVHLTAQQPEGLEQSFWDALGRETRIERIGLETDVAEAPELLWQRWHTLDDAAEALADRLAQLPDTELERQVILIPDVPAIRRTVRRALENRGVPLADPRDPTRLRWDETLKWAMLPLRAVARGYERSAVVSWLRGHLFQPEFGAWATEISARGIRQGMGSYASGHLAQMHSHLQELDSKLGGRRSCEELGAAHLEVLRMAVGEDPERAWVLPFFEKTWQDFIADTARVGQGARRAPALYWVERLQARLDEATPPVERAKPEAGVYLHRLGQMAIAEDCELTLFGLPPLWLTGDGTGDYWFSEREREILSGEFAIRSPIQVREERIRSLRSWFKATRTVTVLDAAYDWDGRERATVLPALREMGLVVGASEDASTPEELVEEMGAHPRWVPSFGALRPVPPLDVRLDPLAARGMREIQATALDHYSRCGFAGLAAGRWRLWDSREPESDLWPEVRGNLLHESIKLLLESRTEEGEFTRTVSDALEGAWRSRPPRGLLRGERIESYVKARIKLVLETFLEKEREYFRRSGARISSLEGPQLRLEYPDFDIIGVPDRVDEHAEGLFILDYKSSSGLPGGQEMLELGYRLQLPFYALAAQRQVGKPAIGVQFVQLDRKGARSSGIFFSRFNGKTQGSLTQVRSNSRSLLAIEPDDAWAQAEEQIVAHARGYADGIFRASPKKGTECASCRFSDLCGKRRLGAEESEEGENE